MIFIHKIKKDFEQKIILKGEGGLTMKMNGGVIGHTYIVKSVVVDDTITRRLEALGVNEMTPVTILNKKGSGSVILKVRGTRLAVGRRISDGIQIEEREDKSNGGK